MMANGFLLQRRNWDRFRKIKPTIIAGFMIILIFYYFL